MYIHLPMLILSKSMLGTKNLTAHDYQSLISRHLCSVKSHLAVVIVCQISDLVVGYTISIGENVEDSFGSLFSHSSIIC